MIMILDDCKGRQDTYLGTNFPFKQCSGILGFESLGYVKSTLCCLLKRLLHTYSAVEGNWVNLVTDM